MLAACLPASLLCLLEGKESTRQRAPEGGGREERRGKGVLINSALPCRGAPEAPALRPLRALTHLPPARLGGRRGCSSSSPAWLLQGCGGCGCGTNNSSGEHITVQGGGGSGGSGGSPTTGPIPPLALPGNCGGGGGGGSSGQEKQRGGDGAADCKAASVEGRCCWGRGRKGKGATPHAGGRRRRRLSPVQLGTYERRGVNETEGGGGRPSLASPRRCQQVGVLELPAAQWTKGGKEGRKKERRNEPVELLSPETPPLDAREELETGTPEKKEPWIEEEVKTAVRAPRSLSRPTPSRERSRPRVGWKMRPKCTFVSCQH